MSLKTLEVEIDHGQVVPPKDEPLPENGRALLVILVSDPSDELVPSELLDSPSIHPEVREVSGLVPSEWDPREDHLRHLLDKHR